MDGPKIKVALLVIAIASAGFWAQGPGPQTPFLACLLWSVCALGAFRWEKLEEWTYRLSSFLGMALATLEACAGLLGLTSRPGLLAMAVLHAMAFALAAAGRYQKAGAARARRDL